LGHEFGSWSSQEVPLRPAGNPAMHTKRGKRGRKEEKESKKHGLGRKHP